MKRKIDDIDVLKKGNEEFPRTSSNSHSSSFSSFSSPLDSKLPEVAHVQKKLKKKQKIEKGNSGLSAVNTYLINSNLASADQEKIKLFLKNIIHLIEQYARNKNTKERYLRELLQYLTENLKDNWSLLALILQIKIKKKSLINRIAQPGVYNSMDFENFIECFDKTKVQRSLAEEKSIQPIMNCIQQILYKDPKWVDWVEKHPYLTLVLISHLENFPYSPKIKLKSNSSESKHSHVDEPSQTKSNNIINRLLPPNRDYINQKEFVQVIFKLLWINALDKDQNVKNYVNLLAVEYQGSTPVHQLIRIITYQLGSVFYGDKTLFFRFLEKCLDLDTFSLWSEPDPALFEVNSAFSSLRQLNRISTVFFVALMHNQHMLIQAILKSHWAKFLSFKQNFSVISGDNIKIKYILSDDEILSHYKFDETIIFIQQQNEGEYQVTALIKKIKDTQGSLIGFSTQGSLIGFSTKLPLFQFLFEKKLTGEVLAKNFPADFMDLLKNVFLHFYDAFAIKLLETSLLKIIAEKDIFLLDQILKLVPLSISDLLHGEDSKFYLHSIYQFYKIGTLSQQQLAKALIQKFLNELLYFLYFLPKPLLFLIMDYHTPESNILNSILDNSYFPQPPILDHSSLIQKSMFAAPKPMPNKKIELFKDKIENTILVFLSAGGQRKPLSLTNFLKNNLDNIRSAKTFSEIRNHLETITNFKAVTAYPCLEAPLKKFFDSIPQQSVSQSSLSCQTSLQESVESVVSLLTLN